MADTKSNRPLGLWREVPEASSFGGMFLSIYGRDCEIVLEKRPTYCDRGRWIAKLFPELGTTFCREIDEADCWPRCYFDLERAKLEVEEWLKVRKQL